ncbi:MAG: uracil-DNA glycosylase, partial [Bacteroidales bacterium]|nr:uracil-DNA glycosylase [Bacteroidales bacterium]
GENIFAAFDHTPFHKVKVVILGQDPYHEPGQAQGLCFSVPNGIKVPPSLVNIIKEINSDLGVAIPEGHGDLTGWADQGVLLLNATLTVRAHQAGSHQRHGWETFTDAAISALSQQRSGLVFLLWGSYAAAKSALIDRSKHLVLTTVHPSPLSAYRGFFGCKHFSQCNAYLQQQGLDPIRWEEIR